MLGPYRYTRLVGVVGAWVFGYMYGRCGCLSKCMCGWCGYVLWAVGGVAVCLGACMCGVAAYRGRCGCMSGCMYVWCGCILWEVWLYVWVHVCVLWLHTVGGVAVCLGACVGGVGMPPLGAYIVCIARCVNVSNL